MIDKIYSKLFFKKPCVKSGMLYCYFENSLNKELNIINLKSNKILTFSIFELDNSSNYSLSMINENDTIELAIFSNKKDADNALQILKNKLYGKTSFTLKTLGLILLSLLLVSPSFAKNEDVKNNNANISDLNIMQPQLNLQGFQGQPQVNIDPNTAQNMEEIKNELNKKIQSLSKIDQNNSDLANQISNQNINVKDIAAALNSQQPQVANPVAQSETQAEPSPQKENFIDKLK